RLAVYDSGIRDVRPDIRILDSAGREVVHFGGHTARIVALSFSGDGRLVASADDAGDVKVWGAATGKEVLSWRWGASPLKRPLSLAVELSADGRRVAVRVRQDAVKILDVVDGRELFSLAEATRLIALSPDGARLATVHGIRGGDWLKVWDVAARKA